MEAQLSKEFTVLQENTSRILKEVSGISSITYYHSPAEGKWSVSQILTHLLTSEKMSIRYMQKKSAAINEVGESDFMEKIRFLALKLSQYIPLKYKAPKIVIDQTPAPLSFGDLTREWQAQREQLRLFLETIDAKQIHKQIYKHPVAGRLSVINALRFFNDHVNHHYPQIKNIIEIQRKQALRHQ